MNSNIIEDINRMAIEVALGDYGGIYDWQFVVINDGIKTARQLNPYENLILAVLSDAISRLTKLTGPNEGTNPARENAGQRARESALRWIKSDRDDYVMDFVSICEHFGWAPSNIRKRIAALIA